MINNNGKLTTGGFNCFVAFPMIWDDCLVDEAYFSWGWFNHQRGVVMVVMYIDLGNLKPSCYHGNDQLDPV